jgi:raffinose/stachyose/melibiose transport system permease protein
MNISSSAAPKTEVIKEKRTKKRIKNKNWIGWLFILPGLIFHIAAVTIPAGMSLYLPFTEWNGLNVPTFIGLDNFVEAFADPVVNTAFLNNIKWALFQITVPIIFAFILAYWLRKVNRGQTVYQGIFFSTSIITVAVAGQIWSWLYNPFTGINYYLEQAGLTFLQWPGLTVPSLALISVLIADMWTGFGTNVIWLLAAMTQLDKSMEEAATLDGAGPFRIMWHVVLPQLRPTLTIIVLLTLLSSFGAFEMVYTMTSGGPDHATETLATYSYSLSTASRRAGYAAAVSLFQMAIALVTIGIYGYLRKKKGWEV